MPRRVPFLERFGLVVLTLDPGTGDTVMTVANWRSMPGTMSIRLLLAAAFTPPLITGESDISSGSVAVMASVILAGLGRRSFGPFPMLFVVAAAPRICVWSLPERTSYGRHLHAIGVNPAVAHLIGVRVERTVFAAVVLGGLIAGIAAVVPAARQGGGVPVNGLDLVLPALAGTCPGATTIRAGQFSIPGTFVGLRCVGVTVSGLTLPGVDAWVQRVFTGGALVAAVPLAHGFQRLATRDH